MMILAHNLRLKISHFECIHIKKWTNDNPNSSFKNLEYSHICFCPAHVFFVHLPFSDQQVLAENLQRMLAFCKVRNWKRPPIRVRTLRFVSVGVLEPAFHMYMQVLWVWMFHLPPDPRLPAVNNSPEQLPRLCLCLLSLSDPETKHRQPAQKSQQSATGIWSSLPGDE